MSKTSCAVYFVTTALTVVPAFAQSNSSSSPANTQQTTSREAPISTSSFVTQAAEGGMFEVQSSQLALKKSQDRDIRNFAQKMIEDHTQANEKLKSLAKNERLPTSLDQEHERMLSRLQGENGSNFADQFKQMQVTAHQQTIALFQNYAQNGSDTQLKQFAQQTLPTLQQHLQMAQQITVANNGNQNQQNAQAQNAGNRNYITSEAAGTWRASKVIGLGVYNQKNEKVGTINELLFDRDGRVSGAVIGVGGFLGIGERNVAVPYGDLTWEMRPVQPTNMADRTPNGAGGNPNGAGANPPGLGNPASPVSPLPNAPGRATTTGSGNSNQPAAYPDHAVLTKASKDQLQNAPQFQYGGAPR